MGKANTSLSNTDYSISPDLSSALRPESQAHALSTSASFGSTIRRVSSLKPAAIVIGAVSAALNLSLPLPVHAQEPARWYQVEVSIFANENVNLTEERWPAERIAGGFPRNVRQLDSLLNFLSLDDWAQINPPLPRTTTQSIPTHGQIIPARSEGPEPFHNSNLRLPDFERDAFVVLLASAHNFTDTNRALNASANYRLLYHSAWRQPVTQAAQAIPIAIQAGRQFGDRHELEGSLTIRFNPSQDRVVLDTLMWLTQFSTIPPMGETLLQLPALPEALRPATANNDTADSFDSVEMPPSYHPRQLIPVRHSRDMRSNEFHYVDHPALGIVIQVFPYTPPPPATLPEDQMAL